RVAHAEMCAQLDEPEDDASGAELDAFDQTVRAWRRQKLDILRERCAPAGAFNAPTVTLRGPGEATSQDWRRWAIALEWLGRIPLGGANVSKLAFAARMGGEEASFPSEEIHEVAVDDAPVELSPSAFVPGHEQDDLLESDGVLLPQNGGKYARADEE